MPRSSSISCAGASRTSTSGARSIATPRSTARRSRKKEYRMLAIRWTIGDVASRGFAALRASVRGAWKLFGDGARYRVYVNTLAVEDARARCGDLPGQVEWCSAHGE